MPDWAGEICPNLATLRGGDNRHTQRQGCQIGRGEIWPNLATLCGGDIRHTQRQGCQIGRTKPAQCGNPASGTHRGRVARLGGGEKSGLIWQPCVEVTSGTHRGRVARLGRGKSDPIWQPCVEVISGTHTHTHTHTHGPTTWQPTALALAARRHLPCLNRALACGSSWVSGDRSGGRCCRTLCR